MSNNFLTADALGNAVTFKTFDTGNGVEASGIVPCDATGNPFSRANPIVVDASGATIPVTIVGSVLATGAATAARQPALGSAGLPSADLISVQGTVNMTPLAVSIVSSSVSLSGGGSSIASGTAGTPASAVISVQGVTNMAPLVVNGSAYTQPVSLSVIPLASDAARASKQPALGIAGTAAVDVLTVQGASTMTPFLVNGSSFVQPVSLSNQSVAISGTLPAFAANPTVNLGTIAGASTLAAQISGNSTLTSILAALQAQRTETIWFDALGVYYIRTDSSNGTTWTDLSGNALAAPTSNPKPIGAGGSASGGASYVIERTSFQASAAAASGQYSVGDYIDHIVTLDPVSGVIVAHFWINVSTETKLAIVPASTDITAVAALVTGAATSAKQTAANATLAAIATTLTTSDASLSQISSGQTAGNTGIAAVVANTGQIHTDLTSTLKTAPQSNAPRKSIAGTLAITLDGVQLSVDGMNTATIQINAGTWIGTLQFQGSLDDGASWFSINVVPFSGGAPTSFTTTWGQWQVECGGLTHVRVSASIISNASASVLIIATTGLRSVRVSNPQNPLSTIVSGSTGMDHSANPLTIPSMSSYTLLTTLPTNLTRSHFGIQNQASVSVQIVRDDGTGNNKTSIVLASGATYTSSTFKGRINVYGPVSSTVAVWED